MQLIYKNKLFVDYLLLKYVNYKAYNLHTRPYHINNSMEKIYRNSLIS